MYDSCIIHAEHFYGRRRQSETLTVITTIASTLSADEQSLPSASDQGQIFTQKRKKTYKENL